MSKGELDDYTLNRIRWKKRDIDDLVAGTHFQVVLEYELFSLERQFAEAVAQGSKEMAVGALEYAQHIEVLIEHYRRPKR